MEMEKENTSRKENTIKMEIALTKILYQSAINEVAESAQEEGYPVSEEKMTKSLDKPMEVADKLYKEFRFMELGTTGDSAELLSTLSIISSVLVIAYSKPRTGNSAGLHAALLLYAKGLVDGIESRKIMEGKVS